MKKTISLLLTLLLILSLMPMAFAANGTCKGSFGAYKHVYIFGVDGAGGAIGRVDTPNFDRIFGEGAVKYDARAEVYTDSGPNWGSILSGASNLRTMYTNGNTSAEGEDWGNGFQMRVYPTIYRFVRKAMPDAVLASYANYSNINDRIIEDGLDVEKVHYGDDASLTNAICDYFDAGNKPTLFYSHIDCVDGAGHSYGSWTSNNDGTHSRSCTANDNKQTENCSYDANGKCTVCGHTKPTTPPSESSTISARSLHW